MQLEYVETMHPHGCIGYDTDTPIIKDFSSFIEPWNVHMLHQSIGLIDTWKPDSLSSTFPVASKMMLKNKGGKE